MCSPPILALPVAGSRSFIDMDASPEQVGAALFQENEVGQRRPIGFWSRQQNVAERKYSVTEKECLALVWRVNSKALSTFE